MSALPQPNQTSRTRLDDLPCPTLLVTAQLHVLRSNLAADRALAAGTGVLHLDRGRLGAVGADAQARLEAGLADVMADGAAVRGLALARPGRLPLTLSIASRGGGVALIEIRDPDHTQVDATLLKQLFGLTTAEAATAVALCDGLATADIADQLEVKPNTVQAHIKKALAKTGTRRQVEMVSLLLRSVAVYTAAQGPHAVRDDPARERGGTYLNRQ